MRARHFPGQLRFLGTVTASRLMSPLAQARPHAPPRRPLHHCCTWHSTRSHTRTLGPASLAALPPPSRPPKPRCSPSHRAAPRSRYAPIVTAAWPLLSLTLWLHARGLAPLAFAFTSTRGATPRFPSRRLECRRVGRPRRAKA